MDPHICKGEESIRQDSKQLANNPTQIGRDEDRNSRWSHICRSLLGVTCRWKIDNGTASMAKYWLTDLQNKVANDCVQLHGGWGYMWEYPVARAFCDGRVQQIYGGSNEIMKELIARSI